MFFFHVRQRNTRFHDRQGIELPDFPAAWQRAFYDARTIVETGVLDGDPDDQWMEIGDETGVVIATLPFRRALATH